MFVPLKSAEYGIQPCQKWQPPFLISRVWGQKKSLPPYSAVLSRQDAAAYSKHPSVSTAWFEPPPGALSQLANFRFGINISDTINSPSQYNQLITQIVLLYPHRSGHCSPRMLRLPSRTLIIGQYGNRLACMTDIFAIGRAVSQYQISIVLNPS